MERSCLYCGCTEDRACLIEAPRSADARVSEMVDAVAGRLGAASGKIGCSWLILPVGLRHVSVCSAPACVETFQAERKRLFEIRPGAASTRCAGCPEHIFWVSHPNSKRPVPVSIATPLGRAPARGAYGYGIDHFENCPASKRRTVVADDPSNGDSSRVVMGQGTL
jgi:hypothetical protein